ncbi:MAG: sigma-54-dependent Fis family transcriptional regulator [Calditrichaceae bacterium]|nr:sigma-54-dependent Fis family transcriptional regulator [Calditrichaceae bacterium]MBN2709823.1 sigma-54-dependent Fis family transcriptional regulator [Calditrichaceae bacterium]
MESPTAKILIVDDNEDILTAAKLLLKQVPYEVHTEKNPEAIPIRLKNDSFDLILLDMNFTRDVTSGVEGFHWLKKIRDIDPGAVVVMITAFGDIETAVTAMKNGAIDFVLKPWQNEKLLATVAAAIKLSRSQNRVRQLESRQRQLIQAMDYPFSEMIGQSRAMQNIFQTIEKVAGTDASVLILGENGTGKELVARALHRRSLRAEEPFISVDMGAIPESLFESELFGHVKGAFTDARMDRAGKFEAASGGALFLDEIGNLSVAMQAKLLRALETRQTVRVGSNKPVSFDVRLICATNRIIADAIADGSFRQDFLYRINTVEIKLPPLRERQEDIPLLVEFFNKQFAKKYNRPVPLISAKAMQKLQAYSWPGNIRELRHTLERAMILNEHNSFDDFDFILSVSEPAKGELVLENYNLEETEKILLQKALNKHRGNISRAAKELGLTRTSLYRRMEKYDL